MKNLSILYLLLCSITAFSQVGINTTTPEGALDISSPNMGLVVPRVTSIEAVVNTSGNAAENGTIVYDTSRSSTCFRVGGEWLCLGINSSGQPEVSVPKISPSAVSNYIKPGNMSPSDNFAEEISVSADGSRFAVTSRNEDGSATGVNGTPNNSSSAAGAVYVFSKVAGVWTQEAYVKASNTSNVDNFGTDVSLSSDGSVLAVGARREDSNATGVNGDQSNNLAGDSGAVYIFNRVGTTWTQVAYVKASNTGALDYFGDQVALSGDGTYLAVGAFQEDSNATGINGDGSNNSGNLAGAAYIFHEESGVWSEQAYMKGDNTEAGDRYGAAVSLNYDGSIVAIGASYEDSNATGVNGDGTNNSNASSGAVYVYNRTGSIWTQEAYIKASNSGNGGFFGRRLSLSSDGLVLAVAQHQEFSSATGVNGDETLSDATGAGAAYIFRKSAGTWAQEAYIKASNTDAGDTFGYSIALSGNGCRLVVGAYDEDSNSQLLDTGETDNSASNAGAAYVYTYNGTTWVFESYLKASNADPGDRFGKCVGLSTSGNLILVGAYREQSAFSGVNANSTNNGGGQAGAAYVIE